MRQSESIAQLAADLAKAQGELKNATENAASNRNKYATLAQVRNCTAPILSKNGISMVQGTTFDGVHFILTTRLLHKSGEWIEGSYPLPIDKNSQLMGSAMTYGRRYCWTSMLGIDDEAAQDDDGEATRPNGKAVEQPDLGSIKGDGASRHASNPLFGHLKDEMETKKNLDDLNLWWVEKQPSIKRMNSEHQQFMFIEMMKRGFDIAPERPDLRRFLISHKPEMKSLEDRSKSAWEGLQDFYDLARARLPEGAAL